MVQTVSTRQRTDLLFAVLILVVGILVPLVVLPSPPAHSDTAFNLLSIRDCLETGNCQSAGTALSFGGFWSGNVWTDFLLLIITLHLSWSNAHLLIAATNAVIAAFFYLRQRRHVSPLDAAVGSAVIVFWSAAVVRAPTLWNPILVPPLATLCVLVFLEAIEKKNTAFFVGAWFLLALAIDAHAVALLLFPVAVVTTLLWSPKPKLAAILCPLAAVCAEVIISPAAARLNWIVLTNHGLAGLSALAVSVVIGIWGRPKMATRPSSSVHGAFVLLGLFCTFLLPHILATLLHHPMATRYLAPSVGFVALFAAMSLQRIGSYLTSRFPARGNQLRYGFAGITLVHVLMDYSPVSGNHMEALAELWRLDDAKELGHQFNDEHLRFSDVHLNLRTPFSFHLLASIGAAMPLHRSAPNRESPNDQLILLPHLFLKTKPTGWNDLPHGPTPASWIRRPSKIRLEHSRACIIQDAREPPRCEQLDPATLTGWFDSEDANYLQRTVPIFPILDRVMPNHSSSDGLPLRLQLEIRVQPLHSRRMFVLLPESIPWEFGAVDRSGNRNEVHTRCLILDSAGNAPIVLEMNAVISPKQQQSAHFGIPALIDFDPNDELVAPTLNPRNWALASPESVVDCVEPGKSDS